MLAAAAVLFGAACTTNPATGEERFTLFMSPEQEERIGREQHEKVIKEFGGVYEDPELARYVASIGQLLASTSERPDLKFTFTVLDTPIVNAFALPGGYVYVSRGLVGLAGNEAELAGVIAHEIGHITARHSAERYSRGVVAQIGLTILGVLSQSPTLQNLAGVGAELVLRGYSREQELEADTLGVRYMTRVGFDPHAMSAFLARLQAHDALEAKVTGRPEDGDVFSLLSTHPRTSARIEQAIQAAGATQVREPIVARDVYLRKIDGLVYGDNPKQGLTKGRLFVHPVLGFRFEVPEGFRLLNSEERVVALGPEGARIVFDGAPREPGMAMTRYLVSVWGRELRLGDVEALNVSGFEAATGWSRIETSQGRLDVRLVAIAFDAQTVYRFAFLSPPGLTERLSLPYRQTTYSFRRLTPAEAERATPLRIRVVQVQHGDTPESLARRQPFESFSLERLRVLNGLGPGQSLAAGELVKVVLE